MQELWLYVYTAKGPAAMPCAEWCGCVCIVAKGPAAIMCVLSGLEEIGQSYGEGLSNHFNYAHLPDPSRKFFYPIYGGPTLESESLSRICCTISHFVTLFCTFVNLAPLYRTIYARWGDLDHTLLTLYSTVSSLSNYYIDY